MQFKTSRRLFLTGLFLASCGVRRSIDREQLTIGIVDYGLGKQSSDRFDLFRQYLEEKLQSSVQIEPTFNEIKALERIRAQAWSLVVAPPGLAAIAMSQYQYSSLVPLEGIEDLRSVLVVRKDSPYQDLRSLAGKKLAIGQPGSATGYYLPLFNFYGLTLAELIVTSTPQATLTAVAQGTADVGALSLQEFNRRQPEVGLSELRILVTDPHRVPNGAILISSTVEAKRQDTIRQVIKDTPSTIAREASFIPTGTVPDYKYMISVVDRVRSIFPADQVQTAALLSQKPVRLFKTAK
jgi:phosphonate transport system substrate-binding protein